MTTPTRRNVLLAALASAAGFVAARCGVAKAAGAKDAGPPPIHSVWSVTSPVAFPEPGPFGVALPYGLNCTTTYTDYCDGEPGRASFVGRLRVCEDAYSRGQRAGDFAQAVRPSRRTGLSSATQDAPGWVCIVWVVDLDPENRSLSIRGEFLWAALALPMGAKVPDVYELAAAADARGREVVRAFDDARKKMIAAWTPPPR